MNLTVIARNLVVFLRQYLKVKTINVETAKEYDDVQTVALYFELWGSAIRITIAASEKSNG